MNTRMTLLFLAVLVFPAFGKDYQLQALESAHSAFRSATNSTMYAKAAQQYESLIREEGIHNGALFYTTGNSWFMAGDLGRAILNFRSAESLIPNNADLKHNLSRALELRTDIIPEKKPHPLVSRLLGWHLSTSSQLRWVLFSIGWILFWALLYWAIRTTRKAVKVGAASSGVLAITLMLSLIAERIMDQYSDPGVITAKEVVARKGDGNMYAPAFLDPLHSGTEFQSLETRGTWRHIRLADHQTCWIPASSAETVALR